MTVEYLYFKSIYLTACNADPAPPLGTILGNLGVNTSMFCTKYNLYTANLPIYFVLKVFIYIFSNKSVDFSVKLPSTSLILQLLKFEMTIKVKVIDHIQDKVISCVKIYSVIKLAKFKFPNLNLKYSLFLLLGTIKSLNLLIVR